MEFSTESRKESLWRNKRPKKQVIAECASPVAFTRSSPGDYQCRPLLQANWPLWEIGTGRSPFCLSVCVRSFPCPCLVLWLSFFLPLFWFSRQESPSVAQTCLKIAAEPLCQPRSTGITGVGYCTWLPPLSPTVWMFLAGCHRHTTLDEFKIQPQTCLQKA